MVSLGFGVFWGGQREEERRVLNILIIVLKQCLIYSNLNIVFDILINSARDNQKSGNMFFLQMSKGTTFSIVFV